MFISAQVKKERNSENDKGAVFIDSVANNHLAFLIVHIDTQSTLYFTEVWHFFLSLDMKMLQVQKTSAFVFYCSHN